MFFVKNKVSKESDSEGLDIKPERSEGLLNKSRRNIGGGSRLIVFFLAIFNLVGLMILGLWFFNTSDYQQQAGQGFVERISLVEEKLENNSTLNKEVIDSIESQSKFLEKEIRKLWDISNKRNRKNIEKNSSKITEITSSLEEFNQVTKTQGARQRAIDLELAKIDKRYSDLKEKFEKLNSLNADSSLDERMIAQEEAVSSFDAYRRQINRSLLSLQERIERLEDITDSSVD